MKVLTAAEMQACDRVTVERYGVPSLKLMRSASFAVAAIARQLFSDAHRVLVLCGRGNNGGDGMMTARLLAEAGLQVNTILLGAPDGLKGDAAAAWEELQAFAHAQRQQSSIHLVTSAEEFLPLNALLQADLIIDALVGTGFQPPLRGLPLAALQWVEQGAREAKILAIDLPSGWSADISADTAEGSPAFPADAVVTFTAPKPAHVFGLLTRGLSDPVIIAPIGSPNEAIISNLGLHWSGSSKAIADVERPANSNKGMYGHVLVIGGSSGKSGAPAMSSLAAMRSGAGLVTAAVTPSVLPLVAAIAPELMTHALAVNPDGEISAGNLHPERLEALLKRITVLAIGPGLGTEPQTAEFVLGLLEQSRLSAVVDADGLNILAANPNRIAAIAKGRTLVLTPHPGEMARLAGKKTAEIEADRINIARDFATKYGLTLVLKGWRTLIAHPDGQIAVNTTGNPAMAKGGSGDLLTGMVAAMLAQHPHDVARAVETAVYLHGLAADITVREPGIGGDQHTLLATDSLANLYRAFHYHPQAENGYVWLQGISPDLGS
ncbi:NAD(P)H-hydrate dehydratase [Acidicapsa dinghuensis]|uniref:Bifunctional NAD(P)H-hydrate repair enzyme n=1 Tax=Acidicapsa dinghuensis TaxID=2218256 RepID=A0ABW1EDZ7_9BACT|nr:NAD(P)H-hydrate dehydratase [Acidicapsa dinghuensis]